MAKPELLNDDTLENSPVVANCRMHRERTLTGGNGYSADLRFNPLDLLRAKTEQNGRAGWLDLCCGTGTALLEAAAIVDCEDLPIDIVGVDLVDLFAAREPMPRSVQLVAASLSDWEPGRRFDLITCVHGLHYLGDKLGLISRAVSWLTDSGLFVANLDVANFKVADCSSSARIINAEFRRNGLQYDSRKKLLRREGCATAMFSLAYLGADDQAGPNYTKQPVVDSYYRQVKSPEL